MESGRRLSVLRQTDLRLARVCLELKCWGLFCDLNVIPHFPPTELAALRRSPFFLLGETFSMYLAHLVKGCQLDDCDATSRLTLSVRGAARCLAGSKGTSFTNLPALSRAQLGELVSRFSFNDECTLLAALSWIFLLRAKSEAIPMRRRPPFEDMSDAGPAYSHSVLGRVGGRLVLKLHRRKHMSSGALPSRGCCRESYAPNGDEMHIPQLFCPACSIWPIVRARVIVGELVFPSLQSSNLIGMMRSIRESLHGSNAVKLGTHSIRRGAARAFFRCRRDIRPALDLDCAVRAYLDHDEEANGATMDILIESSDDEPQMLRARPHSLGDIRSCVRSIFCIWGSSDIGSKYDLDRPVRLAFRMPGLDPILRASEPFYLVRRGPSLDSSVAGFPFPTAVRSPVRGALRPGSSFWSRASRSDDHSQMRLAPGQVT